MSTWYKTTASAFVVAAIMALGSVFTSTATVSAESGVDELNAAVPASGYTQFYADGTSGGDSDTWWMRSSSSNPTLYAGHHTTRSSLTVKHPTNWQVIKNSDRSRFVLKNSSTGKCIWVNASDSGRSTTTRMESCSTSNSHQLFRAAYYVWSNGQGTSVKLINRDDDGRDYCIGIINERAELLKNISYSSCQYDATLLYHRNMPS